MPQPTEEGDFPRGGSKQKAKKRKLQNTEKDLFKTDNDGLKKKKTDSESPKKGGNEKKNKQKNKKQVDNGNSQQTKKTDVPKSQNNKDVNKTPDKNNESLSKNKKKKKGKNKSKVQMKSKVDGESSDKSPSGNKKKKRRNRKKKSGNKKAEKIDHEKKESLGRVEKLHFARVQVGMHILGCVARVDEYSLTFDLPGGLQGEVPITAVSDTYTEQLKRLTSRDSDDEEEDDEGAVVPLSAMYQPGMMFPCRVAAIKIRSGSKKKIFLSMNPSVINKDLVKSHIQEGMLLCGAVTACEEHGYVLDVGVAGTRVFLPDKHAHKYISKFNNDSPIHVGQVLRCQVLSVQGNLINVSINPQKLAKVKLPVGSELDSSSLQSGLQVTATVKEVLKDGLSVSFSGKVGYIHRTHTTQYKHKKSFSPGDQVSATVLYTLNDNSILYLSLLPHLAGSNCCQVYQTLSALADRKTVHQVSALDALKKAVYFNMDGGLKALATLSNLAKVSDYKTPLHKTFSFGTKHSCKVIGFNLVDNILLVRLHKTGSDSDSEETTTASSKKKMKKDKENITSETKSSVKKRKLENDEEAEVSKNDKKSKKSEKASDGAKSGKKKKVLKEDESKEEDTDLLSSRKKKKKEAMEVDEEVSTVTLSSKKKKKADADVEMQEEALSAKKKKKMKEDNEEILSKRKELLSKKAKEESESSGEDSDSDDSDSDADVPSSSNKVKTCLFGENKNMSQKKEKDESEDSESSDSDSDLDNSSSDSSDSDSDEDLTPSSKKKKGQETVRKQVEAETPSKKKKKGEITPGKKTPEETDSGVEVNKMSDSDDEGDLKVLKVAKNPARLSLSTGFSWSEDFCTPGTPDSDDSSDEDTEVKKVAKKTGSELRKERMEEEKAIFAYERQQLEGGQVPLTSEDFDRLTLQSPNSSLVWTRYMAHHLETVEIDKARAVAERALKTISFREEQEKLNVWGAYLNLENMYGGAESVKAVFDRAVQQNEPIRVYKQMVQIYIGSDKMEEAEKLYNVMCKKFSQDKSVWTGFGQFFFRNKRVEPARKLLKRCLKCLEDRDHVEMISKFAQLEYKYGDSQRGCTMFENIFTNYPKRTDLWSVYIDMVVKAGKLDDARALFERVIHMKMSSKKMQFFFKKYLEFEKKHGDTKSVEKVKQKAVDYVEAQGFMETD